MKFKIFNSFLVFLQLFLSLAASAQDDPSKKRYIVKFDDVYQNRVHLAKGLLGQHFSGRYKKEFEAGFPGVVIELSENEFNDLDRLDFIDAIEPDEIVKPNISWGQDRVDQRNLPLDGIYNGSGGLGVDIYIIDTGINPNHNEFSGRVGQTVSMVSGGTDDCQGHGTHVASIAAGEAFGIADEATINSIRISNDCSDGDAYTSDMIDAFYWVLGNASQNSVVNLSYGTSGSVIGDVIESVIVSGHIVTVAAGNDNENPCLAGATHPTLPLAALKVASITSSDVRASSSNYGACFDIFARGASIEAANYASTSGTTYKSGTSMAAPFVAGVAAIYREDNPNADAMEVAEAILDSATSGLVTDSQGTPNLLLFNDLTPPQDYWQPTNQLVTLPGEGAQRPRPGCEAGELHPQALFPFTIAGPGFYVHRIWECQ